MDVIRYFYLNKTPRAQLTDREKEQGYRRLFGSIVGPGIIPEKDLSPQHWMRLQRKKLGLSYRGLAAKLDWSQGRAHQVEVNSIPHRKHNANLAKVFGVSEEEVATRLGNVKKG